MDNKQREEMERGMQNTVFMSQRQHGGVKGAFPWEGGREGWREKDMGECLSLWLVSSEQLMAINASSASFLKIYVQILSLKWRLLKCLPWL